ncbi:MAG: VWA domain-containing protein [Planctomycetes bacterium]|nr:VWA domain-containing protein [Planctomycetota bacterium]
MSRLHFATPEALLLVALALGAFALWRRRLGGALGLAVVLCLCVALARPQWATEARRVARLYALDVSGSTFLDAPKALAAVRRSMAELGADDRVGLMAFAGSPQVALPLSPPRAVPGELALGGQLPRADATDIAALIRSAAEQLAEPACDRQLVLMGDGRQTVGNAELEAAMAAAAGMRVFAIPVGPAEVSDARVALLRAPARVAVGQPFEVEAELAATAPIEATLIIARDGSPLGSARRVALEPGAPHRLSVQDRLDKPGTVAYSASLAVADRCAENNSAQAIVRAEGDTRVLCAAPGDTALARLLAAAPGLDVARVGPAELGELAGRLPGADCLVLDGVAAGQLPAAVQGAVRDWVRDTGAGLVALGGPASYGPGGYTGTPIEDALPVLCALPRKIALLVALDASGSMAERAGGKSKIAFAREAVLRCAGELGASDSFGLMAFAGEPRVVLPVGKVPEAGRLAALLERIEPHGPTELQAALEQANEVLTSATAQVRHIILVSDGQVTDAQASRIRESNLRKRMADAGVTLSAVMTGRDPKAMELLKELAAAGFQFVEDPSNLSAVVLEQLRKITYGNLIQQGKFAVRAAPRAEVAVGVAPGSLAGYVRTVAKPTAVVEWLAGEPPDPVLARWQFGLGRALAFASTVGTEWDAGVWGAEGAGRLWPQAVRWAARPPRTPGFEAQAAERGDEMLLTVRAERDGRFLNGLDLSARILCPDRPRPSSSSLVLDLPLRQTAPGEYQATFPAPVPGAYHATVIEKDKGQRLTLGIVKNYSREWEAFGVDAPSLEAIARSGRGKVLPGLDALREIEPATAPGRADIAWAFLLAALALFVAEVALSLLRSKRVRL